MAGSLKSASAVQRLRSLTPLTGLAPGAHEIATVHAPFSGQPFAELPLAGPADLDHAVEVAREAQAGWASVRARAKADILRRFRTLLLDRSEEILDILQIETGKARRHAFEELADVVFVAAYYDGVAERLLRPRRRKGAIPALTRTVEVRHPRGVV